MNVDRHVVLIIDDDEIALAFGKEILESKYDVYPVLSGEKAFAILEKIKPDIILLDIEKPGMDGYAVLNILKQSPETKDIPVIFLTTHNDPGNELEGLDQGAIDYITKPYSPLIFIQRIETQIRASSRIKKLLSRCEDLQKTVDEQAAEIKSLKKLTATG